jgi:hypothetical protein
MERDLWNSSCEQTIESKNSAIEGDILLGQLVAVLGSPSTGVNESAPIISDVGNILLQLTEAITQAKTEAARERALRVAIESEHHRLVSATTQAPSLDISTSASEDGTILGDCTYQTLSDILTFISALPPHMLDCVYLIYGNLASGVIDQSRIQRVLIPTDVPHDLVQFIMFSDMLYPVTVLKTFPSIGSQLFKYSLETLQQLLGSSPAAMRSTFGDSSSQGGQLDQDEQPRMNLLEALNVQSDDDIRRIITVRKCHKLGFKSHVFLKQYFSRFGKVERVVLLPMRAKPQYGTVSRGNRPSSMGFVVFENESTVQSVLNFDNCSGVHIIKGWPIEVRNFVRPADRPDTPWTSNTGGNTTKTTATPTNSAFDITDSLW